MLIFRLFIFWISSQNSIILSHELHICQFHLILSQNFIYHLYLLTLESSTSSWNSFPNYRLLTSNQTPQLRHLTDISNWAYFKIDSSFFPAKPSLHVLCSWFNEFHHHPFWCLCQKSGYFPYTVPFLLLTLHQSHILQIASPKIIVNIALSVTETIILSLLY